MSITVRQIHPVFVGEVAGVDLAGPLDVATIATLQAAIDRHAVLVFRGQSLTDDQQIAFARHLGEPERYVLSYRHDVKLRLGRPEMVDVSNLDAESGRPQTGAARHRMVNLGNRLWHTDSSFRRPCGGISMLFAHVVPPAGGETEYADTRAAWDTLPESLRTAVAGRFAEHSLMHSRSIIGFTDFAPEERAALPPSEQPLVRTHPRTGRRSLYLGSHASHVVGMAVPEGRLLLMELLEHVTQRANVYRHAWRVGDLVLWDNRSTLHRGLPFDESHARDLRRVTTKDEMLAASAAA